MPGTTGHGSAGHERDVDPVAAVRALGGHAQVRDLLVVTSRARLRTCVQRGGLVRAGRGVYALPRLPAPRMAAAAAGGVLSHGSACGHWGLEQMRVHATVHVTVPRSARPRACPGVTLHWADVTADEVVDGVTSPLRTVLDCASALPFAEGLAIGDSALAASFVSGTALRAAADASRGPGSGRRRRVARAADRRAENPFESALRAIVLERGLSGFEPQCAVRVRGRTVHVDLGDARRRLALEADSFAHHGTRDALVRDCERYDELVVAGWRVLRFAWEQVMFRPEWVGDVVVLACAEPPPQPLHKRPSRGPYVP